MRIAANQHLHVIGVGKYSHHRYYIDRSHYHHLKTVITLSLSFHHHLKRYDDKIETNLRQKLKLKLSLGFEPCSFYVCQLMIKSEQEARYMNNFFFFCDCLEHTLFLSVNSNKIQNMAHS